MVCICKKKVKELHFCILNIYCCYLYVVQSDPTGHSENQCKKIKATWSLLLYDWLVSLCAKFDQTIQQWYAIMEISRACFYTMYSWYGSVGSSGQEAVSKVWNPTLYVWKPLMEDVADWKVMVNLWPLHELCGVAHPWDDIIDCLPMEMLLE